MERNALVLDASIIIKWFTKEENRDKAIAIRKAFIENEIEIAVPDLILYEISNALKHNPLFTSENVKEAIDSLLEIGIDIIIPIPETIHRAIDIAFSSKISLYDAFYIALALDLGFDFITADKKLYEKTKEYGNILLLK